MGNSNVSAVTLTRRGAVALVTIDNPPINALSHAVRSGLADAMAALEADSGVTAVVIAAAGRTFPAGADIAEFGRPPLAPGLATVVQAVEDMAKPVVAALHGTVLGGGLELALGAHARVAAPGTMLGLPEVKLGLIPGAGGTQRLPRLVGASAALDMIVPGTPIPATQALANGLIDAIADGDVLAAAVAHAEHLAAVGRPVPVSARAVDPASVPEGVFDKRRAALGRHPSGPAAPRACVDAVEASVTLPFADGMRRERALFTECYETPYAPALWHVFFAERAAATIPGIGRAVTPRAIAQVGVVGAGLMGSGIALALLNAGLSVTLTDASAESLERGYAHIRTTLEGSAKKGRITEAEAAARLARVTKTDDFEAFADADLVIEAAFEAMDVKLALFARLDGVCRPGAILATNTSTLDVDRIAAATSRPTDVLGLHFFSPANIMRLLEVVRGRETAADVMATAMQFAKKIGKVAVVSGVCPGFIGNRMIHAYGAEAAQLLLEGALPAQVDAAVEAWGFAMGPFAMGDLAGLDVGYRIRREQALPDAERARYAVADAIVERGRLGQKSGAGYYTYEGRTRSVDPEIERLVVDTSAAQGFARRAIGDQEIVERLLFALANTGGKILDEGIALRAGDIDTVYVNGYGFPGWRGGPMWAADAIGLPHMLARVRELHAAYGERWAPAKTLETLAASGGRFADLDKKDS